MALFNKNIAFSRTWHDKAPLGIWLMIISVLVHVTGTVFEKKLLGIYPVLQMAFVRALLRLPPIFSALIKQGDLKAVLAVRQPLCHLLRLTAYVSYNCCMLYALSKASLVTIGSLQYVTPFFTIGFSVWILKEQITKHKWIAIAISFIGVLLTIQPGGEFTAISLLIIFASLIGSLNKILIRKLVSTEHSLTITLFGNAAMVVALLPFAIIYWIPLSWFDLSCFALAGILTASAQYLSVQALRFAEASTLAPLDCTSVIWGALFDCFIWAVIPNGYMILGTSIIIAGNLYLLKTARNSDALARSVKK